MKWTSTPDETEEPDAPLLPAGLHDLVEGHERGFSGRLAVRLALMSDGIEDADELDAAIQARQLQRLLRAEARAFGRLREEQERLRAERARADRLLSRTLVGLAAGLLAAAIALMVLA